MITATQIRNGATFFARHLSQNDYYSEGVTVKGHWRGEGAKLLGLSGVVQDEQFEALRCNQHPVTGERLTPRAREVTFHDLVYSAPKSVSIAAMVGGDERLIQAWREVVEEHFLALEPHAAVRERGGAKAWTEECRRTGNVVCAMYHHDTSRLLDCQLHTHYVMGNLSFDESTGRWLALQPRLMTEVEKTTIRGEMLRSLAGKARELGYRVAWEGERFRLADIDPTLDLRYSQRALQRVEFTKRYEKLFGRAPTPKRVEWFIKDGRKAATQRFVSEFRTEFGRIPSEPELRNFVRDWRSAKMKRSTMEAVWKLQRSRLTDAEWQRLTKVVASAREKEEMREVQAGGLPGSRLNSVGLEDRLVRLRELISGLGKRFRSVEMRTRKFAQESRARAKRKMAKQIYQRTRSREEAIRRFRRGMTIAGALRGFPGGVIASQMRANAKR